MPTRKSLRDDIQKDWYSSTPFNPKIKRDIKVTWCCHKCGKMRVQTLTDRLRRHCACGGNLQRRRAERVLKNKLLCQEWAAAIPITSALLRVTYPWCCVTCGNSWRSTLKNRLTGSQCPRCARRRVGLARRKYIDIPEHVVRDWTHTDIDVHTANRRGRYTFKHVASQRGEKPCGNTWEAYLWSRCGKAKAGCPHCFGIFGLAQIREAKNTWLRVGVRVLVKDYMGYDVEGVVESITTKQVRVDTLLKPIDIRKLTRVVSV